MVPNGSRFVPARWVLIILVALLAPVGYAVLSGSAHERLEGHPVLAERIRAVDGDVEELKHEVDAIRLEQKVQTGTLNEIATMVRLIDERTQRSQ